MPLYIKYFDNDSILGLWYTLLSLVSWVLVCDMGLGNGLRNKLTEALVQKNDGECKKLISSTYAVLAVVIFPIVLIGATVIPFLNLNSFFQISENVISPTVLAHSFIVLFIGICLSFVLRTVNSILYAVQKSAVNNFLSLVTSIIPLIFVFLFKGNNIENNLIILSYVHIIALNLPLLIASIAIFSKGELRNAKPAFRCADISTAKTTLTLGIKFFITQILFMFLINTNELIITTVYSPEAVVDYNIYFKLFTVVGSLFMLALTPMWSKVTKDFAEKKYSLLIKTNKFLLGISALASLAEFLMIPVLQVLINFWLKDEAISVNYLTALFFAFYGSIYILNVVLTTLANGIGSLKTQIIFYGGGSLIKIPIILLLAKLTNDWSTVILYNGIVLFIFCIVQYFWINNTMVKLSAEYEPFENKK